MAYGMNYGIKGVIFLISGRNTDFRHLFYQKSAIYTVRGPYLCVRFIIKD